MTVFISTLRTGAQLAHNWRKITAEIDTVALQFRATPVLGDVVPLETGAQVAQKLAHHLLRHFANWRTLLAQSGAPVLT